MNRFIVYTRKILIGMRGFIRVSKFKQNFITFKALATSDGRFRIRWRDRYPCLDEATKETFFDAHYIYHPAWAARILSATRPRFHVDIASTLAFCATVSAFVPVKFYDYRPANINLEGLSSEKADLLSLPFEDASLSSVSCMHVIEHIGLGRYGDPLDPQGDIKAMLELKRVVAPNGSLLIVVPVGGEAKIMFNAHRIYRFDQIMKQFEDLELINFALVTDDGKFHNPANEELSNRQKYGAGCWWLKNFE